MDDATLNYEQSKEIVEILIQQSIDALASGGEQDES